MRCQACKLEVPETRNVTFYQNIGVLIIRFPSSVEGHFCKACIHYLFWKMTLVSLVAGWWGLISLVTNCYFVINNVVQYIPCCFMRAPSGVPDTSPNQPTPHGPAFERIQRHHQDIIVSLEAGEPRSHVCERVSDRAMVPSSEVERYLRAYIDPQ